MEWYWWVLTVIVVIGIMIKLKVFKVIFDILEAILD